MKKSNYPMSLTRCCARTRQGGSCRQPAMKNGRCRLHGGKSLSGAAHGRYVTGKYTKDALESGRQIDDLLRKCRDSLKQFRLVECNQNE